MRILVDQTFWISLLDPEDPNYEESQKIFSDVLAENNMLYISNYIFNEIIYQIRCKFPDKQETLIQVFEDAMLNNYLKVLYIGRITQKDILKLWKKNADWPYHPMDLANISLMKKRFINAMLSWRKEYKDLHVNVINL